MHLTDHHLLVIGEALRGDVGHRHPEDERRNEIAEILKLLEAEIVGRVRQKNAKPATHSLHVHQLWCHVKTDTIYRVTELSKLESDSTPLVTYVALEDGAPSWTRPVTEFLDGRFKYIGESRSMHFEPGAHYDKEHDVTYLHVLANVEAWVHHSGLKISLGYDQRTGRLTSVMLPGRYDVRWDGGSQNR